MSVLIHTLHLDLDMKLLTSLSKIDRFDAGWASIEKRESFSLLQLKAIATIQSIGASTRIEGSRITDDEVALLIEQFSSATLDKRDEQEVIGYYEAMDLITENYKEIDISENQIKFIHHVLLKYVEKDQWHRGSYKQVSNVVAADMFDGTKHILHHTTEPGLATEDAMMSLIAWYHTDNETLPLIKIAVFVYEFLSIHPFQDGNGRLSRLLSSLLLLKQGYSWIHYMSFEHEIEQRKNEYYSVLMKTQRNRPSENITEWLMYFISCLLNMQVKLMKSLEASNVAISLSQREHQMVTFIQYHAGCSSSSISLKLQIPLPTIKKSLNTLINKNIIMKSGIGKSTGYFVK